MRQSPARLRKRASAYERGSQSFDNPAAKRQVLTRDFVQEPDKRLVDRFGLLELRPVPGIVEHQEPAQVGQVGAGGLFGRALGALGPVGPAAGGGRRVVRAAGGG